MRYFPMDFSEMTLDGLVHTGAPLSCSTPEADLRKVLLLGLPSIFKEGSAPKFWIIHVNGHLDHTCKNPKSTVELKFEISNIDFNEILFYKVTITLN